MKKKICLLKYVDSRQTDGGQRVAVNLANALCRKYEVHFIALITNGDKMEYSLNENVHFKRVNMQGKRMRQIIFPLVKDFRSYFKKNKINVVFSIGASPNVFMLLGCLGKGIRTIYCEHVNIVKNEMNDKSQRLCQALGAMFSDYVVTLTERDKNAFERKFTLRKSKIRYIYNWIENEIYHKSSEYCASAKKIITVGRITPVKGLENLVAVATKVLTKHPDWSWHIFGTGDKAYVDKISKLIEDSGVSAQLKLMGQVSDIYDRYREYSFFVLTSEWEGLPMVLLEAKANRLPLVSYDCPTGPSEIIRNDVDGYLIPMGATKEMIGKIDRLMDDEGLREELSENAHGNLDKFSKEKILHEWEKLINA